MNQNEKNNALYIAAGNGETETVKALLDAGADVHYEDDNALCLAAQKSRTEIVKILLDAGANIHAKKDGALRLTAVNGRTDIAKILLDAGADVHADDDGALRLAAKHGRTEIAKILLDHGANIHARNDEALRIAVELGRTEVVTLLNAHLAQLEKESLLSRAAITVPDLPSAPKRRLGGAQDKVGDMDQNEKSEALSDAILNAVKDNNIPEVKRLLESGANPNTIDDMRNGESLLCCASNTKMMDVLLQHGADVNQQDFRGYTPLHWHNTNVEQSTFLLQHGADPHIKNEQGFRAQDTAFEDDAIDLVALKYSLEKEALLSRAAITVPDLPVYQKKRMGGAQDNVLHVALRFGELDDARVLLDTRPELMTEKNHEGKRPFAVADVEAVDSKGNSALHYAAAYGEKQDVLDLIQRGADYELQNNKGFTPVDWSIQSENDVTNSALEDLMNRSRNFAMDR